MRRFSRFITDNSTYIMGWDMINRWSYVSTLEAMSRYHTVYQSNYSPFSRTVFCSETSPSGLSLGCVGVNKLRRWMMSARNSAPMSNRGHVSAYMQFWKKERTVVKMCCPTWQWQHFALFFDNLCWILGVQRVSPLHDGMGLPAY